MSSSPGFIAEQPEELWEPWMRQVDQALDDERLLEIIQDVWRTTALR
jgi:hypothetical protein